MTNNAMIRVRFITKRLRVESDIFFGQVIAFAAVAIEAHSAKVFGRSVQ